MFIDQTIELFRIEITEEGDYFAVRSESPMFCLRGKSIVEVATLAEKAFESYKYYLRERK